MCLLFWWLHLTGSLVHVSFSRVEIFVNILNLEHVLVTVSLEVCQLSLSATESYPGKTDLMCTAAKAYQRMQQIYFKKLQRTSVATACSPTRITDFLACHITTGLEMVHSRLYHEVHDFQIVVRLHSTRINVILFRLIRNVHPSQQRPL
jgi:hypothetical protein